MNWGDEGEGGGGRGGNNWEKQLAEKLLIPIQNTYAEIGFDIIIIIGG